MTIIVTLASAQSWITPKKYFEKVGSDGFKHHPVGLGPYKFVSMKPGIELVMEANEDYWRKVPSVKRLVFLSVPEGTTRLAMLKRGEVDVAYLLEGELGESIRNDPELKLVFSGGVATFVLDFFDMWDPKSPWHDQRVRKAACLVARVVHSAGYNLLSFTRAFAVLNCQSALVCFLLRSACH